MNVFISYSSVEIEKAHFIASVLEKNKISVWIAPECIPAGSNYTREIPKAIRGCDVFLLLLSDHAQDSFWVSAEVETALKNEKVVIPFVIENCSIRDEFDFMLSRYQRIEAYDKQAEALESLVRRIKGITNNRTVDVEIDLSEDKSSATVRKVADNGAVYEGDFINNNMTGYGKLTWKEGTVYEGDFINGVRTGKGKLKWTDGGHYEGDFLNNLRHGKGKHTWASGITYEGDYTDDEITGWGITRWTDGGYYVGDHVKGLREGRGEYHGNIVIKGEWKNNDLYNGEYYDRSGNVTSIYKNGVETKVEKKINPVEKPLYDDVVVLPQKLPSDAVRTDYKNSWCIGRKVNGNYEGYCEYTWESGNKYQGNMVKGLFEGMARMTWAGGNGTIYEGEYKNDKRTGWGKLTWSDGSTHTGEFVNGKREGRGEYRGKTFVKRGTWKDDKFSDGTEYALDGKIRATYKNGKKI